MTEAGRRYFEDFSKGEVIDLGAVSLDREAIVAFAERWDPQPFHLDEAAAENSLLGGLSASGWHTAALLMRLMVDNFLSGAAALGAPGVDALAWKAPVRPGDTLSARVAITGTRASRSRPTLGLLSLAFTVTNQAGDTVMTMKCPVFIRRRETASR